ncbi:Uma2 family endonuclease [bacterium]|nr:Uma2 family endonuclease [bacterium]
MPRAVPPSEKFTYSEFCSRVQEQKADLIRGEIIMAAPATVKHEELVNYLSTLLRLFVKKQKLGMVIGSRVAMKLDDENAPEPDLMFIRNDRLHLLGNTEIFGPADVAIEVISPGSRRLDTVDKKKLYAEFGVAEYWLIDIHKQEAHFWRNENATWKNLPVDKNGIFHSVAITGFWLRLDWLFAAEQPDEVEIVQTILAELPARN